MGVSGNLVQLSPALEGLRTGKLQSQNGFFRHANHSLSWVAVAVIC
jgi:hypothetical protein